MREDVSEGAREVSFQMENPPVRAASVRLMYCDSINQQREPKANTLEE